MCVRASRFNVPFITLFINAQDSLGNLIGQNVIMCGVYLRMVVDMCMCHRMCQLFGSCFVRCATRISTNKSDGDWYHVPDSCFVCPQYMNLPISIWLYTTKITFILHFENKMVLIGRDYAKNESLTLTPETTKAVVGF